MNTILIKSLADFCKYVEIDKWIQTFTWKCKRLNNPEQEQNWIAYTPVIKIYYKAIFIKQV